MSAVFSSARVMPPGELKTKIENAPDKIWLEATVYWGGKEQDRSKRLLEHAYSRHRDGFY